MQQILSHFNSGHETGLALADLRSSKVDWPPAEDDLDLPDDQSTLDNLNRAQTVRNALNSTELIDDIDVIAESNIPISFKFQFIRIDNWYLFLYNKLVFHNEMSYANLYQRGNTTPA